MKAVNYFIIKVDKAVNDTIDVDGNELYLDNRFNEFEHRAMSGEIVAVPEKYATGAQPGDTLYFHHNVLLGGQHMQYNGAEMQEEKGPRGQVIDHKKGLYYARYDKSDAFANQCFAFKHGDQITMMGEWVFLDPYVVKPLESKYLTLVLDKSMEDRNKYGILKYPSPITEELGIKVGDRCWIRNSADYEMEVEGEKVYRTYIGAIYGTVQEV